MKKNVKGKETYVFWNVVHIRRPDGSIAGTFGTPDREESERKLEEFKKNDDLKFFTFEIVEYERVELKEFMYSVGPTGAVYVKERAFFAQQGGFDEDWGKSWKPIRGKYVEDARRRAYERESKP